MKEEHNRPILRSYFLVETSRKIVVLSCGELLVVKHLYVLLMLLQYVNYQALLEN